MGRITIVPAPTTAVPALYSTTVATIGAATVVTIATGMPFQKLGLRRIRIKHIAGSAASFTPYLFNETGVATPGDVAQEFAGVSTLVGVLFDPSIEIPTTMITDVSGNLYLMFAPNTGSNNQFEYTLHFDVYE